jgi:tetratricopeptide (TPR) repeat protein
VRREIRNPHEHWQRAADLSAGGRFGRPLVQVHGRLRRCWVVPGSILVLGGWFLLVCSSLSAAQSQAVKDYLQEAKRLEEKQDFDGAIKVYLHGLSALPDQPEFLKRLGIIYQTQLKFPESIQAFEKALRVDPQYPETNFYLGISYLGYNDYGKALGYFEKELKFHPEYRRAHLYAAKVLLALGKEGEAIQHYQALTQQNPRDARVWFELASLYRSLAVHAYKQLEGIDPDSVMLDVLRAEADSDDLRYEDAVKRYKQALKKQPDFPGLHFAIGQVYFKMDKPIEAEPELRLALQEDPSNPPANYMLGQTLLRNKKANEALPFLQAGANGDSTFMKGHLELGKCYLQLGNVEEARQALLKAVEADPHSPEPHVLLVQVYMRLKDEEKRKAELVLIQKLEQESKERVQGALEKAARKKE